MYFSLRVNDYIRVSDHEEFIVLSVMIRMKKWKSWPIVFIDVYDKNQVSGQPCKQIELNNHIKKTTYLSSFI